MKFSRFGLHGEPTYDEIRQEVLPSPFDSLEYLALCREVLPSLNGLVEEHRQMQREIAAAKRRDTLLENRNAARKGSP